MMRSSSGGLQAGGAGRRRARLADIARIAGVSESTVSRALRADPQISERTRTRVLDVARELDYVPNLAARRLAGRTSGALGLIVPDVTDPMHALVVAGFESMASEHDYTVIVLNGSRDPQRETRALRQFQAHQVDGVAFCATITEPAASARAVRPAPTVFIGPEGASGQPSRDLPAVGCLATADAEGISDLVTHLLASGRRVLSYVGGSGIASDRIRQQAVATALERSGLEPRLRTYSPSESWADFARIAALVERERPEALICYDDRAALTVMAALRERGIRVPDDVAVTGFDDIPFARISNPPLTTVAQPAESLGTRAASMLLDAMASGEMAESLVLPVELIARESSGDAGVANAGGPFEHR